MKPPLLMWHRGALRNKCAGRRRIVAVCCAAVLLGTQLLGLSVPVAAAGEYVGPLPFTDIASSSEAAAISFVADAGIMKGFPDGAFDPTAPVTRAQAAVAVVRLIGAQEAADALAGTQPSFSDGATIPSWAWGAVNLLQDQGIVQGFSDGTFQPNELITDANVARWLIRAVGDEHEIPPSAPPCCVDQNYRVGDVVAAYRLGIPDGLPFLANLPASRGDFAQMAYNAVVRTPVYSACTTNGTTDFCGGPPLYQVEAVNGYRVVQAQVVTASTSSVSYTAGETTASAPWGTSYQVFGANGLSALAGVWADLLLNPAGDVVFAQVLAAPPTFPTSSAGVVASPPFSDIAGLPQEPAIAWTYVTGLMYGFPDGTWQPEGSLTRAQMAKMVVYLLGLGDAASALANTQPTCSDAATVPTWAWGYVNLAVGLGWMPCLSDGNFQPNAPVTDAQVAQALINAIGDGAYAATFSGAFPVNYTAAALNLGLTTGVDFVANLPATRADVAQMAFNAAVEVPVCAAVANGACAMAPPLYQSGVAGWRVYTGTVTNAGPDSLTWSTAAGTVTRGWESTYELLGVPSVPDLVNHPVIIEVDSAGKIVFVFVPLTATPRGGVLLLVTSTLCPSGCDVAPANSGTQQDQIQLDGTWYNVLGSTALTLNGAGTVLSKSLDNAVAYPTIAGSGGNGSMDLTSLAMYQNDVTGKVTALSMSDGALSSVTLQSSNGPSVTYRVDSSFTGTAEVVVGAVVTLALDAAGEARAVVGTSANPTVTLSPALPIGLSVTINGASTEAPTADEISWSWGDGTTSTGFFPQTHTYAQAGTYAVIVTVVLGNGRSGSAEETVTVGTTAGVQAPLSVMPDASASHGNAAGLSISVPAVVYGDTEQSATGEKIAGYQLTVSSSDPMAVRLDPASCPAPFTGCAANVDQHAGTETVAAAVYQGVAPPTNLAFVPVRLTGPVTEAVQVTTTLQSVVDQHDTALGTPAPVTVTLQRGAVYQACSTDGTPVVGYRGLSVADAVAALQYLVKLRQAGTGCGQVNPVALASLVPVGTGLGSTPSVADVVALLQYLVGLRGPHMNLHSGAS